ncbi:MAG: carboxypeptidase-like regulatory domain-containing protein [Acidobacteria bacterium]|nr:carboxypeptidase-like regulatory domain-containing protein [Acidobacteriota bacterium]
MILRVFPLMAAAALAAFGQATATGLLAGRVTDTTDAVIPNVTVKLKNTTTGATREAVTNGSISSPS